MSTDAVGLQAGVGNGRAGDEKVANSCDQPIDLQRVKCYLTESLLKRVLRKIFPDQRKYERYLVPPLVGYLGTVRASKPYELADISLSGFCMLTDERWTPGTEMPITLQRASLLGQDDPECFTVQATVVRCGSDGVGFSIVLCEDDSRAAYGNPMKVRWVSKAQMELFMRRLREAPQVSAPPDLVTEQPADAASGKAAGTSDLAPIFQAGS